MAVSFKKKMGPGPGASARAAEAKKKVTKALAVGRPPAVTNEEKFKRIYSMAKDQREMVNSMMVEGKPMKDIVVTIQEGWGLFDDIQPSSLLKYLYRYKWGVVDKQIIVAKVQEEPENFIDSKKKAQILSEVVGSIDVITEVAELVVLQKGRVSKLYNREKDMPMLFNSLGGEMKTLSGFLQQYADLSFELGIMKKIPKLTKVTNKDGEVTMIESDGKDHVALSIETNKRIEEATEKFFEALEGKTPAQSLLREDA